MRIASVLTISLVATLNLSLGCNRDSITTQATPVSKATTEDAQKLSLDANQLMATALAAAKSENKNVLVVFTMKQCGYCVVLKKFLNEVEDLLEQDYRFLTINVMTMENGLKIRDGITSDPTLPWMCILNSDGEKIVDSVLPSGKNIGAPIATDDSRHFMSMIKSSSKNLSTDQLAQIETKLDQFMKPLRDGLKKGDRSPIGELITQADLDAL